VFSWLRGLPFIESGTDGIFPHDVVRDALEMDLHWRDPVSYEEIHRRVRNYVLSELIGRKMTGDRCAVDRPVAAPAEHRGAQGAAGPAGTA